MAQPPSPTTAAPLPLDALTTADLARADVQFTAAGHAYATSGRRLGHGGSGTAWLLTRWPDADPGAPAETVVGKVFHPELRELFRSDGAARRHAEHNREVLAAISGIDSDGLLPLYLAAPIADNFLLVTPLAGESLVALLAGRRLAPRERVELLLDAVRGLAALHARGIVHRDVTLNNVLVRSAAARAGERGHAVLFDFDLSVAPARLDVELRTYHDYYEGRIAGAPEYSVAPELCDEVLAFDPISPRIDVYAVGTALFALFTERSIYGEAPDLATLLERITEGVVHRGQSRIVWPDELPGELRAIIEHAVERDPGDRFPDALAMLPALEAATARLSGIAGAARFRTTLDYVAPPLRARQERVYRERRDERLTLDDVRRMDRALAHHGYLVSESLGRVKGYPIFLARPDPELVATGRFPDANTYPKIVTAIDTRRRPPDEAEAFVATWLGRIRPILERVRTGHLTPLYRAVHDAEAGELLLFSEYVADPRFGGDLARHALTLEEALGLGVIVALSLARLHAEGLAHDNVRAESLLFRGDGEARRVQALFVGLVEPSFEESARAGDVRALAGLIADWVRPSRIDALHSDLRPALVGLRDHLVAVAGGEAPAPSIEGLVDIVTGGLGLVEPNFELVRAAAGDVHAYADLLVRHSLYSRLYG